MITTTQVATTVVKDESIGNIGTLKVSKELQKTIDYLHYKIGATEWSGILFYKLTKGNINTLKDLEFTATFCYPMNIGNSTYTEFDYNGEVINAYDIHEEGIEQSTGLIHSHHSMGTFFSSTDSSELKDNAKNYNYYVSLIVNFAHEYCAKVAIPTKTKVKSESWFKNTDGKLVKKVFTKEEDLILIGDLNVIIEGENTADEWLTSRIKVLEDKKKTAITPINTGNYTPGVTQRSFYDGYNDDEVWGGYKNYATPVREASVGKPTSERFLSALIQLDASKTYSDIGKSLEAVSKLADDELELYSQGLDENIEIIHDNIYKDSLNMNVHCLEALLALSEYDAEYGDSQVYLDLKQILADYGTL